MSKFQKLKMTKSTLSVHSRNTPFSSPSSKNSSKQNQISQPALKKKKGGKPSKKYHLITDTVSKQNHKHICCGTSRITSQKIKGHTTRGISLGFARIIGQIHTGLPAGHNFTLSGYSKTARHV